MPVLGDHEIFVLVCSVQAFQKEFFELLEFTGFYYFSGKRTETYVLIKHFTNVPVPYKLHISQSW